ncbi:MAG: glutamine-hydrolyzing GMP synthase, partial [Lentisphaeraceae bacterium]|nr:glutamine-hydrolyzing GMP synthase [Lentisphaeraceae bacterium]
HLIANRVRRLGVYSEIVQPTAELSTLSEYSGLIFSGGPSSVYADNAPSFNADILNFDKPILGICYGHQVICHTLGGQVKPGDVKEYGVAKINIQENSGLFADLDQQETVWMSHGDSVKVIPEGFNIIASTDDCPVAAIEWPERKIFGLQYHPEVTHSVNGLDMMKNFLKVCECNFDWNLKSYLDDSIKKIQEQAAGRKVFLLVSGGVDSNVAFSLLNKALGEENVYGLHIDNGFMRKNESVWVKKTLEEAGFNNFHVVNAAETFLTNVEGVWEPQEKRVIIGDTFLDVKTQAVEDTHLVDDSWLLGQGTIYPDTIESGGTEHAALIKTHHNRVDRVQELIRQGKVIEPLADLYKDEVRELGELLGLPHKLVWRHPFPGPGLAVRALCSGDEEIGDYKETEAKINEYLADKGLTARVLPVKSVGVQGDARTYAHPCLVSGEASWETLGEISTNITNRFAEVNRVVYQISDEDWSGDIHLNKAYLTKDRLDTLRDADQVVTDFLYAENLYEEIWQMPVALLPVSLKKGGSSLILRPINSTEAMTANFCHLPFDAVKRMVKEIDKVVKFDGIFYDVTNKPPGTIEWE